MEGRASQGVARYRAPGSCRYRAETKDGFLGAERDEASQDAPVAIDAVSHRPRDK